MDRRRSLLKIAALRTEREHQERVDASKGYFTTTDSGLLRDGAMSLEAFFEYGGSTNNYQAPISLSSGMLELIMPPSVDVMRIYCGGQGVDYNLTPGERYHIVISYDGTLAYYYVNGEKVGSITPKNYVVGRSFSIGANNSGYYPYIWPFGYARIYNYALSAEEDAALYNDGDPTGYVLPVPYKFKVADYISDFSKNADGWFAPPDSPGTSINTGEGVLSVSGDSTVLRIQHNGMASGDKPGIFRVRIAFAAPFTGSMVQVFAHSSLDYAYLTLSVDKLKAEGIVHLEKSLTTRGNAYIYLLDVPIGDVVKISTITIESVGCIAEYLPQNLVGSLYDEPVEIVGINSYTWTGVDDSTYAKIINLSRKLTEGQSYRFAFTVSGYEAGAPFFVANRGINTYIPAQNGTYAIDVLIEKPYENIIYIYGGNAGTDRRLTLTVDSIEPIPGIASVWLDSAKQLPLNDEYLPPLLEPIVIGDATPVRITGNNSYTWTGADDPIRNFRIRLSHSSIPGQVYRVKYTISNYEAGLPAIWICGTTVSHLPAENGTRTIIITSQHSADLCDLYGGSEGTDRRLTFTLDSVEPVLERGYDLTAVGTPEIPAYSWLASSWMMKEPMSLDDLIVYPGGTVPPAIVDGALRITCNEKVGSYGGGGRYSKIIDARPGDSVEWSFQIRSSRSLEAMISLSVKGRLYYIKVTNCTPEWQQYSYVTPIAVNPATDFWISKAYNDTNPGWIDIKNIIIKVYRK